MAKTLGFELCLSLVLFPFVSLSHTHTHTHTHTLSLSLSLSLSLLYMSPHLCLCIFGSVCLFHVDHHTLSLSSCTLTRRAQFVSKTTVMAKNSHLTFASICLCLFCTHTHTPQPHFSLSHLKSAVSQKDNGDCQKSRLDVCIELCLSLFLPSFCPVFFFPTYLCLSLSPSHIVRSRCLT